MNTNYFVASYFSYYYYILYNICELCVYTDCFFLLARLKTKYVL